MTGYNHDILEHYETELQLFTIWMKNQGMTKSTEQAYLADTCQYLRSIYPTELSQTGKIHMMRFLSLMRENGSGDEARNRKLSSLRAFYKSLIEMEHLNVNPAALTAKSKMTKNRIPVYLEDHELELLFQSIEGKYKYRNMTILLLMAYAGLRVGEVHRLNVQDFQPSGSIHVLGKGRKWRIIPLPAPLSAILRQALEERIVPKQSKEHAFFVSQFGRRLSIRMIQTIADETLARLKDKVPTLALKKLSSHKLRHSFATMQIRSGTDIRTLQELLGHASIETTQIYTHVDNKQLQGAMNNISDKIPSGLER
ncbi:tyrosine-type recombinase/integrase [Paenibacillus beijingensis]|uniref:Recombinase XerC n=1 Tax=Paenibacillus beijingensis TaxID=1126833 RepID=A0A0D5NNL9_9BACL|nr:tyrosine-type recombinase/integrase [Paenibacillus beijingensis]AJY76740.1 hypothetical protein VN24_21935 [Paenibacillus beijingensis]